MNRRVLFVDDEPHVLDGFRRHLRRQIDFDAATSGAAALEKIRSQHGATPYAVIVSDMGMPVMGGAELLQETRRTSPDSVRIMLTGNADQQTAIDAINDGNIFRFLTKPCPPDHLRNTIEAGIEQHRLITAEKELLTKTLSGVVGVLVEILALVNPAACGHSKRIRNVVTKLCSGLQIDETWQIHIATMLSQIGCLTMPQSVLERLYQCNSLTLEERHMVDAHPRVAWNLLSKIPRLQDVANLVLYQRKKFDGTGFPDDIVKETDIPLGARILKVATDYETLIAKGMDKSTALDVLRERSGWYDPQVIQALSSAVVAKQQHSLKQLALRELEVGMVPCHHIVSTGGDILISKGKELTRPLLERLNSYCAQTGVQQPIEVAVPI